jgi:hypothetical protein
MGVEKNEPHFLQEEEWGFSFNVDSEGCFIKGF